MYSSHHPRLLSAIPAYSQNLFSRFSLPSRFNPLTRTAGFSLKKRPNENSEQFKQCFFRFLRFLLRDLVKRKHRSIIKERGIQAARQAAEKSSKSKAQANAVAGASTVGGGGGDFEADDPLRRQAPLRPPSSSSSASTRPSASLPAAVRG